MKQILLGALLLIISLCGCKNKIEEVTYYEEDIDTYGAEYSINGLKVNDDYKEIDIKDGFQDYTKMLENFYNSEGFVVALRDFDIEQEEVDKQLDYIFKINKFKTGKMEVYVEMKGDNQSIQKVYIKNGKYYIQRDSDEYELNWSLNHLLIDEYFTFLNVKETFIKKAFKVVKDDSIIYRFDIKIPENESSEFFGTGSKNADNQNLEDVILILNTRNSNILDATLIYRYVYSESEAFIKSELKFDDFGNQTIDFPEDMESWPVVNQD